MATNALSPWTAVPWQLDKGGTDLGEMYANPAIGWNNALLQNAQFAGPARIIGGHGEQDYDYLNPEAGRYLQQQGYTAQSRPLDKYTTEYGFLDPSGNEVAGAGYQTRIDPAGDLRGLAMVAAAPIAGYYAAGAAGGGAAGTGGAVGGTGISAGAGATGGLTAGAGGGAGITAGTGGAIGGVGTGAAGAAGAGMGTFDWVNLAANVGSSLLQSEAAKDAAARGQTATDAATAEQRRQFDITQQNQAPWLQTGSQAIQRAGQLANQYETPIDLSGVMNEPGYQFGLNQGINALQNTAAARGGLFSGATGKATTRYATDYATTKLNDAWNRLNNERTSAFNRQATLGGAGQIAANQLQSAGQNYANQFGSLQTGNAALQGRADLAQGDIWGNTLTGAASWWNNRKQPGGYADGGAVRREPVIGTKGPVRRGGGGGLSREAVLAAIDQAQPAQPKQGIAALPGNPVTDPRAIIEGRQKAAGVGYACGGKVRKNYMQGGMVDGPGGPRDDAIPAQLSDGEHVMDAASVTALGGGDNELGQQRLNALRALVKGGGYAG